MQEEFMTRISFLRSIGDDEGVNGFGFGDAPFHISLF